MATLASLAEPRAIPINILSKLITSPGARYNEVPSISQACSLMTTWSFLLTCPFSKASMASTRVINLVMLAGGSCRCSLLALRTFPESASIST